jgi:nucleotide-binding universal stress UspA family protein
MQKFRRVLTALDLSKQDTVLLHFLRTNASLLGIEKVYFLHIMPDFSAPKQLDVAFQKLFAPEYPIDEKVRDKLSLDAQEILGDDCPFSFDVEVIEGKPYEKLLHWTNIKEINLLIVGKKDISEGSGITAKRVARNTKNNILFVPTESMPDIKRILVPLDFSKNSYNAIQTALELKAKADDISVEAVYVVDLPPEDYYSRSKSGTGYRGILLESAQAAFETFVHEYKLNADHFKMTYLENTKNSIIHHLKIVAEKEEETLVLMGAKGHSPFETFLFGSVTEKLVGMPLKMPILIVR